jgi:hypothetical protein
MYSPRERGLVRTDLGLGEVDGLFNIGKMFTRMFTFTPSSFKLKNIAGAIGSAVTTIGTGGIANIASELVGHSGLGLTNTTLTSAHSDVMKIAGYTAVAAGAAVGVAYGGAALLGPGTGAGLTTAGTAVGTASSGSSIIGAATGQAVSTGFTVGGVMSAVGSGLSTIGSGLMAAMQALPLIGQVLGGGGGQQQDFGPQQPTADQVAAQAAYDAQQAAYMKQQQETMYQPGYNPSIPYVTDQYAGAPVPSMNTSYGDLRSPYTAITEDGEQVQVDPATGQVISSKFSTPMLIGGGAVVLLLGLYMMSDDSK